MSYKMLHICLSIPFVAGFASQSTLFGPSIAGNSTGNLAAVWSKINADAIYEIQSCTGQIGSSWGSPSAISSSSNGFYPSVSMNSSSNFLMIWQPLGSNYLGVNLASSPLSGPISSPLSLSSERSSCPKIVIDNQGNRFAIWQEFDGSLNRLVFGLYPASLGSWILTERTLPSRLPPMADIAIDPGTGNGVIVWQENQGGSCVVCATSISPGAVVFSQVLELSASGVFSTQPQAVFSTTGEILVIWQTSVSGVKSICTSSLISGNWSSRTTLSSSSNNLLNPSVAINGQGEAMIIALEQSAVGDSSSVVFAYREASRIWGNFTLLESIPKDLSTFPQIAMSEEGTSSIALAAWQYRCEGGFGIRVATLDPSMSWTLFNLASCLTEQNVNPVVWMNPTGARGVALWLCKSANDQEVKASFFSSLSGVWSAPETISDP